MTLPSCPACRDVKEADRSRRAGDVSTPRIHKQRLWGHDGIRLRSIDSTRARSEVCVCVCAFVVDPRSRQAGPGGAQVVVSDVWIVGVA
jgi:hypothetical protein